MLCAGILPINQMRDYIAPAAVIASRVPLHLLEAAYGLHITRQLDFKDNPNRPPTAHEMLTAYCMVKGYITNGTGRWDEFRACKELLRDFNDGRILFVAPPYSLLTPAVDYDPETSPAPAAPSHATVTAASTATGTGASGALAGAGLSEEFLAKWLVETEKVMMKKERVAERLAEAKVTAAAAVEEEKKKSQGLFGGVGGSGMVFGGKGWEIDDGDDSDEEREAGEAGGGESKKKEPKEKKEKKVRGEGEFEDGDKSSSDEEGDDDDDEDNSDDGRTNATLPDLEMSLHPRREHKRLKHWGKKNKKLRDKDSYGEENGVISYAAYSTTRVKGVLKEKERKRHEGRGLAGVEYTRAVLPHHLQPLSTQQPHQQQQQGEGEGEEEVMLKRKMAALSTKTATSSVN